MSFNVFKATHNWIKPVLGSLKYNILGLFKCNKNSHVHNWWADISTTANSYQSVSLF